MKRLLLDTHIILWWLSGDRRLALSGRRLIDSSHCTVSVVSMAEIAIKVAAGKVRMPALPALDEKLRDAGVAVVSLTPAHVVAAARLMGHHPDVFDCLLAGTALAEQMTLLTRDAALLENAAPLMGELLIEA
ncbi:MAG: type II toxin-antitoxin system VapC family toxin [Caldimonas sp.]